MLFEVNNKKRILKGDDRSPGYMMFLHEINNNIIIFDAIWGGYQEKYENLEIYQEINTFWGANQNQKTE